MRRDRVKQLLMIAFAVTGMLTAQTKIDLSSQARRIDFSNSTAVKPVPVGTVLPATCSVGEMFFKLDAPDGENLYMCPAKDIWTQAASPLSMQAGPAGGVLISSTGESFDVDADTMFVASQGGNNQFTGHNDFGGAASLRVATGPMEPAVAACDTASETGSIYVLTGSSGKANLLYICQAIPGGYAWRPGTYSQETAPPSTCAVGEVFFDTDAPAGENWLGCTSPNVWTMLGKQNQKGVTPPGTCAVGDVFFDTDAPAGENWLGCTSPNVWTMLGKQSQKGINAPGTCAVGDVFFDTDATAGENLLGCTSPNVWTMLGKQSQKGINAPGTCAVGDVFFDTDAAAGENLLGCTSTNIWTMLGKQIQKGITTPGTCAVGDVFFDTDAAAGENWLGCTSTNVWTVLGKQTQKGTTPPVSCAVGDVFFDTDAPAGENWLGCTSPNVWTMLGKQSQKGTTAPGTCTVGDVFFDTDAVAGENLLGCTSPNVWTMFGKQTQKGINAPGTCAVGDVFFDTDAVAGENWLGCTSANVWTVLGKQTQKGTTPPVSCAVGDVFFDTDAPAGENWLGCTSANNWTVLGKTSVSQSRLLTWQKQAAATTLIGGETVIASVIVPGGTIPAGACLRFRAGFQHAGAASVEYRIRYGASYLMALAPTTNTQIARLEGFMCNDPASTGSQQIAAGYMLSTSNSSEQMTTMTVDSTLDQMFSLAAVGPATDSVTLRYFLVEVLK